MQGVEEEGWRFVAFVRLVPFFPFNLVNYAFGLTQIRIREYVAASFVCMAPGALAYTWLGYAGQEAASGQSAAIREGLLALALLAAVALLPRLIRRLKGPRFIDPDELKRRLDSREQLGLIDVRTPDEFLGPLGHIVSAENIPVAQLPGEIGKIKESRENLLVTICPYRMQARRGAIATLEQQPPQQSKLDSDSPQKSSQSGKDGAAVLKLSGVPNGRFY